MRKTVSTLVICLTLLATVSPGRATDDAFSFYGLEFGMGRAEVGQRIALDGNLAREPGHGLSSLELVFDREEQLMEIRASWPRPEDPFALQGLQRALRERFLAPIAARFPSIAATVDEYGDRAAVRLILVATAIRERNVDYHKARYLKLLQ